MGKYPHQIGAGQGFNMTIHRLVPAMLLAVGTVALLPGTSHASSHREAPFISGQARVDGTDFYMFNSYEAGRQGYVTIIADYQPIQAPSAGPVYYPLDHDALYEIHIDNTGTGMPGLTFGFQFTDVNHEVGIPVGDKLVQIPLRYAGPITATDNSKQNSQELYTVTVFRGGANARAGAQFLTNKADGKQVFEKPIDYVGKKTLPDYEGYAKSKIYDVNIPGCDVPGRVFVGQRKDPFAVNVAEIFDLVNLDPLGAMDQGKDDLKTANVTSFIMEVSAKCLAGDNKIIGGYTTASLPADRAGAAAAALQNPDRNVDGAGTQWVQVSRVGMPLVNELVIGLKDKDKFNASQPKDDAQFLDYVTNPTLPALLEILFADKGVKAPVTPRMDLVTVFLKGIPGVNENGSTCEYLRLNVTTPPTPADAQSNLGVLGKDNAGFPNGRRPGDDVVDISLRVAMGVLLPADQAPSGQLPFTDGALVSPAKFDATFPYLRTPLTNSPQGSAAAAAQ